MVGQSKRKGIPKLQKSTVPSPLPKKSQSKSQRAGMSSSTDEMGPYKNGNGLSERLRSMKKAAPDDLRPEYRRGDLGPGVRSKYLESYQSGTNLVLLPLAQRPRRYLPWLR